MSLALHLCSEHDVAKVITALVESAEAARARGDATAERLYLKLADRIEDALTEVAPVGFDERVARAREDWRASAAERARLARVRAT